MTTTVKLKTSPANRKEIAQAFGQNQSQVRHIESMTTDITVTLPDSIDGASSIAQQALTLAQALQQVAYVVTQANATVPGADVLGAGAGLSLTLGAGTITISLSVPVAVPNGGTGLQSLTANAVVIGNGTNPPTFASPGMNGYVLTSNGVSSAPTFSALPASVNSLIAGTGISVSSSTGNVTVSLQTPVSIANGGTGSTTASGALTNLGALAKASNLSDLSSASTARTNLGLGTAATQNTSAFLQPSNNLSDVASASTSRTNLGLGTAATQNSTAFAQVSNNLSDLASITSARSNLGLGTMATQSDGSVAVTGGSVSGLTTLSSQTDAILNYSAGNQRGIFWEVGGNIRWKIITDGSAESGGNAGSNMLIASFSDAGAFTGSPVTINRASGAVSLSGTLTSGDTNLMRTTAGFGNGAAAQIATMTNGPTAGNPTKWIPINDNGTTRYIPAW